MANDGITIHLGDAFLLDITDTEMKHLYIAIAKTGYYCFCLVIIEKHQQRH